MHEQEQTGEEKYMDSVMISAKQLKDQPATKFIGMDTRKASSDSTGAEDLIIR
jgi:hypothetical protein